MTDQQTSPTWHPLTQMLALALAYCATGKLGLLLAIPPGYATAIWPPSGIALGALLLFGRRLWPGVWLGSVLANLATSLDPSSAGSVARSLLVAAVIGLGAAAQAGLGEALVRQGARRLALINEREAFRFFMRGGPLACLVSATVGVSTLIAARSIPWSAAPFNWWTWWVGDTIGVLIFAPLVLMWCDRSGEWRKRRWAVTLPIAGTFAAAVLVFVYTTRSESRELKSRFVGTAIAGYAGSLAAQPGRTGADSECRLRAVLRRAPGARPVGARSFGARRCRLLQVLANLLSNAAKFSPAGGAVEIGIEHEGGRARVSVRDHEPGISPEFQPRLFQKFSQADSSDTRSQPGTGLGLAISKALVEQMHGSIGYETDAGVGTIFYFDLPSSLYEGARHTAVV